MPDRFPGITKIQTGIPEPELCRTVGGDDGLNGIIHHPEFTPAGSEKRL